jgi:site-specific DNA-methyltransferase (adenine-specific)
MTPLKLPDGKGLEVVWVPLGKISRYPNNPRDNDYAVDAVAKSIKEFGWRQPIVVDAQGVIIVGDTRYRAAEKLGEKLVPVHYARDLPREMALAYRVADNRLGELARWDTKLLEEEIITLKELGVNLDLTGLDELEIGRYTAGTPQVPQKEYDESIAEGVKTATCPNCQHEFPL